MFVVVIITQQKSMADICEMDLSVRSLSQNEANISRKNIKISLTGIHNSKSYTIEKFPCIFGRIPECDVQIRSLCVSRRHAELYLDREGVPWLQDNSVSGSFINGEMIGLRNRGRLKEGDVIRISEPEHEWRVSIHEFEIVPDVLVLDGEGDGRTARETVPEVRVVKMKQLRRNIHADVASLSVEEMHKTIYCLQEQVKAARNETDTRLRKQKSELRKKYHRRALVYQIANYHKKSAEELRKELSEFDEQCALSQRDAGHITPCESQNSVDIEIPAVDITEDTTPPGCVKISEVEEALENELQCPICTELFIEPVTLSCSHTFCLHCWERWKEQQHFHCPTCRERVSSCNPSLALKTYIDRAVSLLSTDYQIKRQQAIKEHADARKQMEEDAHDRVLVSRIRIRPSRYSLRHQRRRLVVDLAGDIRPTRRSVLVPEPYVIDSD